MAQLNIVVNTSYRLYCVKKIGTFQREALQELSLPCRYMNKIYSALFAKCSPHDFRQYYFLVLIMINSVNAKALLLIIEGIPVYCRLE